MNTIIIPHIFQGNVAVPASKSHTIRRLLVASLAEGRSALENPLDSLDAASCVSVCRALGAEIDAATDNWQITGFGGTAGMKRPSDVLDVGNSGTTLFLALAVAALGSFPISFTGDEQIARRSALPLLDALRSLGARVDSADGCVPITVTGPISGGTARLACPTSQYLSALLLAAPLAREGVVTEIEVPLLNERPYIEMTLGYLDEQGVQYEANDDFSHFKITGGHTYHAYSAPVPADFSSAAFPAAAAVISGGRGTLRNLNPADSQGDKAFFTEFLPALGADVRWESDVSPAGGTTKKQWNVSVARRGELRGGTFDFNATPDMLPAAAAVAAFAQGETRFVNVAHARIKETDRIACMAAELGKMGVRCEELPDGLVVHGGGAVKGGNSAVPLEVDGHGDHRIVMALACAALGASGPVAIAGGEAVAVTYPAFWTMLNGA